MPRDGCSLLQVPWVDYKPSYIGFCQHLITHKMLFAKRFTADEVHCALC